MKTTRSTPHLVIDVMLPPTSVTLLISRSEPTDPDIIDVLSQRQEEATQTLLTETTGPDISKGIVAAERQKHISHQLVQLFGTVGQFIHRACWDREEAPSVKTLRGEMHGGAGGRPQP